MTAPSGRPLFKKQLRQSLNLVVPQREPLHHRDSLVQPFHRLPQSSRCTGRNRARLWMSWHQLDLLTGMAYNGLMLGSANSSVSCSSDAPILNLENYDSLSLRDTAQDFVPVKRRAIVFSAWVVLNLRQLA